MTADLAMLLHPSDDVAIARVALTPGARVRHAGAVVTQPVPAGHKVAIRGIAAGSAVRRYGQIIGFATCPIAAGEHVHVHNLGMGAFSKDYAFGADVRPIEYERSPAMFDGIVRADGRIATRNYIGILTTVNCSATVAKGIEAHFDAKRIADFPRVDGVVALTHPMGCCIDLAGAGMRLLQRTLAGYARHPNFGGLLIIGLGCEANQIARLLESHALQESDVCRAFAIQEVGGSSKAIANGISLINEMLPHVARVRRQSVPASHLILGLQCGGSDGYSGITANPALGAAADILVRHGGAAVLAETPEIYGAEHLLTRRAVSEQVGRKLLSLIEWWEAHARKNDGEINNNPTPGNKAGGLTTILEKSLGAVAKGGTSNLEAVYEYAEPIASKGFAFMDTPGYDPISVTGLVAGGTNIVCFTTGRGSGFGCAPAPSLKLSTNTGLWQRQEEDIDLNCGEIIDHGVSVQEMGRRIFQQLLQTASGKKTKSELQGYGHNEFVPWFVGAVM